MSIESPDLDDRRWDDLVAEAKAILERGAPGWTDRSPHDPGIVLLELFAHLTDVMLYRLNQVPDKAYREFLKLMGLAMRPPAAATVRLRLEAGAPAAQPIAIPRGTRASVRRAGGGAEPPVFVCATDAVIPAGEQSVEVLARHCELVDGELIGTGTGAGAQTAQLGRPPVIAPTGTPLDLVVGVEAQGRELEDRAGARDQDGKAFRLWREVDSFVDCAPDDPVYVADRLTGRIQFAPALRPAPTDQDPDPPQRPMAAVPAVGREIRAWYARGGGPAANVVAGAIEVLKDAVAGVTKVSNPEAATGGRPAETLQEALIRGPQEIHAVERAMTAQDYERVAIRYGGAVARARAFTKAALWRHAAPGTVEVLLVPYVDPGELAGGRLTPELLHAHETEEARTQIQAAIDQRRPLGTTCLVNWASYKTVRVRARVVVRREEDLEAVRGRVLERLYRTISPLPGGGAAGWPFGQALRASHVFDMVLKEPGVRFVDTVRMLVDFAPAENVKALAADAFQPRTWYAGAGERVFRSLNDAAGWESGAAFAGETIERIRSHPEQPGLVAVTTAVAGGSRVHLSFDAGETWDPFAVPKPEFAIEDAAWSMKGSEPTLLLATGVGLYELAIEEGASPLQILVTPDQTQGFYAVAVAVDALGARNVAVAAQSTGGVWLSSDGGAPSSFRNVGLGGEDLRVLAVQRVGPRAFLWAAAAAAGADDPGKGAWRWELRGGEDPPDKWVPFGRNWKAGSCWGLAFRDTSVFAASHHGGVLRLDSRAAAASWIPSDVNTHLPQRDLQGFSFVQVDDVAASATTVLAAGAQGVYASPDVAVYASCSETEFTETVELPGTWLFVSGEHELTVVSEGDDGA
ncbi:MAG: putative baseplate assembly protein [Solirubrobacteraceae bacterium]